MIKNHTDYERLFVEYEILLHSLDEVPQKKLHDIEVIIQEYESNMNVSSTGIQHSSLLDILLMRSELTQSGLAEALAVSQPLINRILRGNVKISKKLAKKLAVYFRLDIRLFGAI